MFTVSYNEFIECPFFSDYVISYMNGLKIMQMSSAKVILNVDTKVAYVYWD